MRGLPRHVPTIHVIEKRLCFHQLFLFFSPQYLGCFTPNIFDKSMPVGTFHFDIGGSNANFHRISIASFLHLTIPVLNEMMLPGNNHELMMKSNSSMIISQNLMIDKVAKHNNILNF